MMGMGVPTPAAYLLSATVVAPSLVHMGFEPIAAHMFVLYFAILSVLTPPVCPGVYVAAGIADSDWLKTAWVAIRLALVTYLLPFMFILNTSLLMLGSTSMIIWSVAAATIGVCILAAGAMGYLLADLGIVTRFVLIAAALLCFTGNLTYVCIGLTVGGIIFAYQWVNRKNMNNGEKLFLSPKA